MASLGRFLGALGPITFVVSWTVAGGVRTGYEPLDEPISRLFELGAPNRWMVIAGVVTYALGAIAFAGFLWGRGVRAGAVFMGLAGAAALGIVAFPCSPGCPGPGLATDDGHVLAAGTNYASFALAALSTTVTFRRRHEAATGYLALSLSLALVGAAGLAAQAVGAPHDGLLQRVGLTSLDVWMVATALRPPGSGAGHDR